MAPNPSSTLLNALLSCLEGNRDVLLQYDAARQQLVPYPWYVTLVH